VRSFIDQDFEDKYVDTEFKKIPGKSPEMAFFNKEGEELERLDITKLSRVELNKLLVAKGIRARGGRDEF